MSDDDKLDKNAILERRKLLIAAALVGMGACSSREEPPPGPCLSVPIDYRPGGAGGAANEGTSSAGTASSTTGGSTATGPEPQVCLSVPMPTSSAKP